MGSKSTSRKEQLKSSDLTLTVKERPDIDESLPFDMPSVEIPLFIAKNKAAAYQDHMKENTLLITADTIVWLDDKVYGKPVDAQDAKRMLKELSGKTHQVITGVCITTKDYTKAFACVTDVVFDNLSTEQIEYYVNTYNPYDKAGAYGIQEWIGYTGVKSSSGSYFNVMGLPVQKLSQELMKI